MYNYYDELNKVCDAIGQYISRVNAGVIVIPNEELSQDMSPIEWTVNRLICEVISSAR